MAALQAPNFLRLLAVVAFIPAAAAWDTISGFSGPTVDYWCIGDSGVAGTFPACPATEHQAAAFCSSEPSCMGFNMHAGWGGGCAQYCGGAGAALEAKSTWTGYMKDLTMHSSPASASGDPHLQNVHGERFDVTVPGNHVLINIPRGERAEHAMLRVQADARRVGEQCTDMYFQALNVTGSWAEANHAGGYHYSVSQSEVEAPKWAAFGKVNLKIVRGQTDSGVPYFNLYAKHLGQAGLNVGGLLGDDDHSDVSTPAAACLQHMSLMKSPARARGPGSPGAGVAIATFA